MTSKRRPHGLLWVVIIFVGSPMPSRSCLQIVMISSSLALYDLNSPHYPPPLVRIAGQGRPHRSTGLSASVLHVQQCNISEYAPGYEDSIGD
jgi:hypothetical protein